MKTHTGFTLIELMVTLAVAVILVTVAAPQLGQFLRKNEVAAHTNAFVRALNNARSIAVSDNRTITMCQSADQQDCSGNAGNWGKGWVVWEDTNGNGSVDSGEQIFEVHVALSDNTALDGNGSTAITFNPSGLTGTSFTFDLTPANCTDKEARRISINAAGQPRLTDTACP